MEAVETMAVMVGSMESMRATGMADPFEELFVAEYARVVAIANRVLADPHEAEDVAQEVFTQFHRRHVPDRRAPVAPFAASWLHAAAVHTALNVVRGRRRRAQREAAEASAFQRLQAGASAALDPQRALEEGEQRREVRAALARLKPKMAAVLALRYSGLSYAEVAAALGVRTGQVGTLLHRAEAALRKELGRATPQ
jgi:RNA polymerase sigma-70 factor (ECF subfamily)